MKIARLDGSTVGEIADHKSLFPNTSFPASGPSIQWLAANSCAEVVTFLAYDSATQKNESVEPYLSGGKVYTRRVTDMTSEEQAAVVTAANEATAKRNRTERDRRLAETDFHALSDVTMSSDMSAYRQALRDITSHANWPNLEYPDMDGSGGDWPTKPS
jgi:hypothetical protein